MTNLPKLRACLTLIAAGLAALPVAAQARDYGQQGAVFGIAEQDLLRTIETRLKTLQANGGIERMNQLFAARSEAKIRRPDPVPGIGPALRERTWDYDPAVVIDHDVSDLKGNPIVRKGARINPLEMINLRQALVFIDGDDAAQVSWALQHYSEANAKLVMVKGAPLELMTRHQRRFYFDQGGYLAERFGIRAVPAVAQQAGVVMRLREIPVSPRRSGS
jgi:conjugal transfer pilus assembly protein TraW